MRTALKARVAELGPDRRAEASTAVRGHLAASGLWARSRVVMLFAADETEPDLDALIALGTEQGKVVCLPEVDWAGKRLVPRAVGSVQDLEAGRHGIRVPGAWCAAVPPESVDLMVVPGVGFTRDGVRVGRGGGFYDRFLGGLADEGSSRVITVGACFGVQLVKRAPADRHDRRMDGLVTEAGLEMVATDTEGTG
ncbi:MAG: 5-formyltetrahydrofolate cyclo-ligase [Planctomycetes bacterium]|nr:5-formyltetrahydrofolate cyclo-ligase [Planctomycetota bacterium]